MNVFDTISSGYDVGMLPLEWLILRRLRRRAFCPLRGYVLEVGVGTGVNLPLYGPEACVVACDASEGMLANSGRGRRRNGVPLIQADGHSLPFADGSFDVVTASLVFCSIANPKRALIEARRVLNGGGRLVLLEHTRGRGLGAWLTDTFHPLWHAWSGECHLNRETVQTVAKVGFKVERVERHAMGIVQVIEAVA